MRNIRNIVYVKNNDRRDLCWELQFLRKTANIHVSSYRSPSCACFLCSFFSLISLKFHFLAKRTKQADVSWDNFGKTSTFEFVGTEWPSTSSQATFIHENSQKRLNGLSEIRRAAVSRRQRHGGKRRQKQSPAIKYPSAIPRCTPLRSKVRKLLPPGALIH